MSEIGQKVIAAVRAAAASQPDHVYESDCFGGCNYIRMEKPSCIVGHGLWAVGLINAKSSIDGRDDSSIAGVVRDESWDLDPSEVSWLQVVQNYQDGGYAWARAVALADEEAAL